jgi:hypothetical protein
MQRFFSIIIIFAILLVGGAWIFIQKSDQAAAAKRAEDLGAARRSFMDKARSAMREESAEAYERDIKSSIAAYNEELKKRVYAKKPEAFNPAAYKDLADEQFKEGLLKEGEHKSRMEGYAIVRGAYDTLMSGNWRTALTAQSKEIRLDLYDVKRAKDDEGQPVLEGKFFFWGIEDNTRVTWGPLALRYWKIEKEKIEKGPEKGTEKEVEKVLGKADGESTPRIIIQGPSKYVAEFPPLVSIGFMWLPVMPREATFADIEIGLVAKTPSGDKDIVLKWEKFKIPENWKLGEGESWEADVVEATEDEIAGKEGAEGEAGKEEE